MNILITGSKGFIGSYLVQKLNKGNSIIEVDKKNGKLQDLRNINNSFFKRIAREKIDMIIHLAANPLVRYSVKDPSLAKENLEITYNILEFARNNNIKKIIFSSSREVYGNQKIKSYKETDSRTWLAESPYSASKVAGETLFSSYKACYGINHVIARLSNVFGLNDHRSRFIPILFKNLPRGKRIDIFGAEKELDFTYIDDCVDGIQIIVNNFNKLSRQEIPIYNIAYGEGEKLVDIAKYTKKLMGSKSQIRIIKSYLGEVVYYQADVNKFKKLTGWKAETTVYQGINKMHKEIKS